MTFPEDDDIRPILGSNRYPSLRREGATLPLDIFSIVIGAVPSALFGGYVGHILAQVRQKEAALIGAKNALDQVLVNERLAITSGKRDEGVDLDVALAVQEVAYRNFERCLPYLQRRSAKRTWLVYCSAIYKGYEPKRRLGFRPKPGDLGYENPREVSVELARLLKLVR